MPYEKFDARASRPGIVQHSLGFREPRLGLEDFLWPSAVLQFGQFLFAQFQFGAGEVQLYGDGLGAQLNNGLTHRLLRIILSDHADGVAFVDGGNVFFRPVDFSFGDIEFTFGPGVSLATPAGPVAVFYGRKIDPDPGEDSGRWHFTFGRIF